MSYCVVVIDPDISFMGLLLPSPGNFQWVCFSLTQKCTLNFFKKTIKKLLRFFSTAFFITKVSRTVKNIIYLMCIYLHSLKTLDLEVVHAFHAFFGENKAGF